MINFKGAYRVMNKQLRKAVIAGNWKMNKTPLKPLLWLRK